MTLNNNAQKDYSKLPETKAVIHRITVMSLIRKDDVKLCWQGSVQPQTDVGLYQKCCAIKSAGKTKYFLKQNLTVIQSQEDKKRWGCSGIVMEFGVKIISLIMRFGTRVMWQQSLPRWERGIWVLWPCLLSDDWLVCFGEMNDAYPSKNGVALSSWKRERILDAWHSLIDSQPGRNNNRQNKSVRKY